LFETFHVDANIFILSLIYGASGRGRDAAKILKLIETGRLFAYTSYLTWDEVVWVILMTLSKADSIESGKKLIGFPNLRFVEVSESVVTKSQTLTEKYQKLKSRDAIHCS
jgi:predicted nucleic acid-binding protein